MSRITDFLGESAEIRQLKHLALQVAKTEVSVLITGETGSGKEVLARFIHDNSRRSQEQFIPVNCAAIPSGILESELFGHEKGAFTGAVQSRKGYFETADRGTIFLDEIGDMPLETQVKVLRVIESGDFQRVGASEIVRSDARIIAATNKNLPQAVAEKTFREDLYYRLHSVELRLPPLRERGQDILLLAGHFIRLFERKHGISFEGFTSDSSEMLLRYNWPGNVRELRNLLESILILERGKQITPDILDRHLAQRTRHKSLVYDPEKSEKNELNLIYSSLIRLHQEITEIKQILSHEQEETARETKPPLLLPPAPNREEPGGEAREKTSAQREILTIEELEKRAISQALETFGGNRRQTAKALGLNERTLYRKLRTYGLDGRRFG